MPSAVSARAPGEPGRREIALRLTAGGWRSTLPVVVNVRPSGRLTGTVVRAGGGGQLAAKLFVEDAGGRLHVVPGETNYRTQSWYAPWQPRYSCVNGRLAMPLPPGAYRVTAMKGFGWRDACDVAAGRLGAVAVRSAMLCWSSRRPNKAT